MTRIHNRYQQIEDLYQRVLDEPLDQRQSFLARVCGDDDELRREVEALLHHYSAAQPEFLNQPAHGLAQASDRGQDHPPRIGAYRILGRLGEGGMGVVYRAEQENPRREVALKVMRLGMIGERGLHRFELEAAILGRLRHPGIAQIYETGLHADSFGPCPFFAMELVDGSPLTTFAESLHLEMRERLKLVVEVCEAVHYAHQKGVVHRDLKPANILVVVPSENPADGSKREPVAPVSSASGAGSYHLKILDFGVALTTDSDLAATTMHTESGQLIGTLPYMSPEQVAGDAAAIDIRSDVYSLGVILYELLCGRMPFDVSGKTLATAARIIAEQDPVPPGRIDRALRGDFQTIVLKALEKQPDRRYQSASELATDIRRYLQHEPIAARPATTVYQLSKFARRNRGLVAGLSAALVVLVAGAAVSTSFAVGQFQALGESERQRRVAEAVNEFLNKDLLSSADPANQLDRNVTVRQVVDRASAVIASRFLNEPLIEAGIRLTLSDTYKSLGEYAEATAHAERALTLYRTHGAADGRDALQAANKLGQIQYRAGRIDDAERLLREALQSATARLGPEDELTLSITNNLALALERKGRLGEAAEMFERVYDVRMRLLGEEHKKTRTSMNNLAMVYVSMGKYAKAEPLHVRELELSRRIDGPEHPDTLISLNNLAVLYGNRKQPDKAEPYIQEALEISERVLGPNHPRTLEYLNTLAMHYLDLKRRDEAELVYKRILDNAGHALGPDDPLTVTALDGLSAIYLLEGRLEEAEAISQKTYEWRRRVQGEDHVDTGATLSVLARIYFNQGKLAEAEAAARKGYEILVRTQGEDGVATRGIATTLRDISQQLGRTAEVELWDARLNASKLTRTTISGDH